MGFGLVLARPSQNKRIWFKACVVVCCGVETKYRSTFHTRPTDPLLRNRGQWKRNTWPFEYSRLKNLSANYKLQYIWPIFYISLNKDSDYCYIPRSSEHTDKCN